MARTLVEQTTMRKVYWRLLPFAILTYFLCYLDRINVGFAALTMNKDLGLDPATYGMAAGAFFWGYFLFEVPSNMILEKVGARLWIARIMVTWGIISGATAFCVGPYSFLTVRFLLGLAEAGLFPGLVLFFTYWFPDHHRARIISGFMLALPIAVAADRASRAPRHLGPCGLAVDVHSRSCTHSPARHRRPGICDRSPRRSTLARPRRERLAH